MKRIFTYAPYFSLLLLSIPAANAQSGFDLNMGFGTARVGSNGSGIGTPASVNPFGVCSPAAGDPTCQATPSLGGFFLGFGGDLMLKTHFGVGAEANLQPSKSDYGPLQYRQLFYDFNGIYAPVNRKRVMLQLQGGIGGARTGFSLADNECIGTAVCTNVSQGVGTSNHFQWHTGVGVQLFVANHFFVRPQFDYHYVPGFTQQFGSNSVPQGSVWVGYSWGER